MNRRTEYFSVAAGAVLLFSGYAKALDAAAFAAALAQYGSGAAHWAAPVIVLTELLLGFALLLGIRLRRTGAAATLFLAAATGAYAYGVFFRGVSDCGCFGAGSVLNGPPAATFLRNALLAGLTSAVWRGGDDRSNIPAAARLLLVGGLCTGAFMCRYTLRTGAGSGLHSEATAEPVAGSPLAGLADLSADSTYLVFAFSYTCPHCLN